MQKRIHSAILLMTLGFLNACSSETKPTIVPAIVPNLPKVEAQPEPKRVSDVIGAVEPIYILPMKSAFNARIDTGATTSSIDAEDVREFERDGQKWLSFTVVNRRSGERYTFEKPIVKNIRIKRIESPESRRKVMLPVSFGGKKFTTEFTVAERKSFKYQALIGRNILTGRYIVDTSLSHTLK
jgi:hypothetical protein